VQIQLAALALDGARDAETATAEFITKLNPLWAEKCTPRPASALVPGNDVAKNDVLLIDTATQTAIPSGKVVLIPDDPKRPIPPPIPVTSDGKMTLPPVQPHDRLVLLPENHAKVELTGGNLPSETGARRPRETAAADRARYALRWRWRRRPRRRAGACRPVRGSPGADEPVAGRRSPLWHGRVSAHRLRRRGTRLCAAEARRATGSDHHQKWADDHP